MNKELEELKAELPEYAKAIDRVAGAAKKIAYMQSAIQRYRVKDHVEALYEYKEAQVELLRMIAQ